MKKILAVLVALVLVATTGSFAAFAEGPVTIEFWHSFSSGTNLECIEKIIADFNALHEGEYEVVGTYQGNYAEILSKLTVGFAAGECPVVSFCDSVDTPSLTMFGMTTDLSQYDTEYDFAQYMPGLMNYGTGPDGDFYAVPFGRSTPLMYVNLAVLEAATGSKEIPQNRDEFVAALEAIRDNTEVIPFSCDMICWYFANFLTSDGGKFFSADGETSYFSYNEGGLKSLTFWKSLADNGLYKAPAVDGSFSPTEQFIQGNVAFIFGSTGSLNNITSNAEFEMGAAFLPAAQCYSVATGGCNMVLLSTASDEEKVGGWEFMKYATSLEVNAYVNRQTGYMLNHVNSAELEEVQTLWTEKPLFKVAYDQLVYVDDQYVSPYFATMNLEIVALLQQMLQDGTLTAEEAYTNLLSIANDVMPNGDKDTIE